MIRQNNFQQEQAIKIANDVKSKLREGIELAKSKWTENWANRINDIANTPRNAWKDVTTLKEWIQGRYKSPDIVRFKNKYGIFSETNEENIDLSPTHFKKYSTAK